MQQAFGMAVPETTAEMCRPTTSAVLVYDAQVGILAHVQEPDRLVERITDVLRAARASGAPVLYVRHVSLPPTHLGVAALRTAMAWQRVTGVTEQQWWAATEPYLARVFDAERFPTAARVGPVAGEELQAAYAPERTFEFGLARLLDGIGVLVEGRRGPG